MNFFSVFFFLRVIDFSSIHTQTIRNDDYINMNNKILQKPCPQIRYASIYVKNVSVKKITTKKKTHEQKIYCIDNELDNG